MTKRRRSDLAVEASRLNQEQLARLGGEIKASRRRRRMTQQELSDLVDIARSTVSAVERGRGGGHTLDTWQRIGVALARPLLVEFARDELEAPKDGGHLGVQELVIRCAKGSAFRAFFELATRPAEPWRSADVGLRDDRRRLLVLVECWNTIGDVGVAAR